MDATKRQAQTEVERLLSDGYTPRQIIDFLSDGDALKSEGYTDDDIGLVDAMQGHAERVQSRLAEHIETEAGAAYGPDNHVKSPTGQAFYAELDGYRYVWYMLPMADWYDPEHTADGDYSGAADWSKPDAVEPIS